MAIDGVSQPDVIEIEEGLRLRKFDWNYDFALEWYQDEDTVWLIDGDRIPYTEELMKKMYAYQDQGSELYFIEVLENGTYKPIGDVGFDQYDMPIMIGDSTYRRKGIGSKVVKALIQRAKDLGYRDIEVEEVYDWNIGSKKMFTNLGFKACKKMPNGYSYRLIL